MSTKEAIVLRIRELCSENHMSINRLAIESGIPASTLKSIMQGKVENVGIATIKKLCDGLKMSLYDFFDDELFKGLEQEIK